MKSLNPKRIAAVVGGAALLATGLAFAGPISFQNVPIISNSGQPLVQIVVGTLAKPSDGVAAANIAAAIGNLAYTSVPVTASVNTTQAAKVLHAVLPSSAKYSLTNQQVYFNESTTAYISGTYSFSALIGSVFNRGVKTNQYGATKTLQSSSQYTYPEEDVISPSGVSMPSPFTTYGSVPFEYSVTASTSGGGVSFSSFSVGTNDNILRVTSSQLPALASNMGANLESEYLWLTGMPVFDQGSNNNINQFNLTNVGGAYQAVFGNPIEFRSSSNGVNNAQLQLFGQNWTIINYMLPGTSAYNSTSGVKTTTSLDTVSGGGLSLASSLEPEKTVYVGQNYSTGGAENFTVQVADIGQPNSNGISPAALKVYLNGALYNVSAVNPGTTAKFNDSGHNLYVKVYQTFAGLYAYEKYAKIQLYSNVVNVTSGNEFNSTYDKGWNIDLLWTNTSSTTSAGNAIALQSIVVFNTTPTYLTPGQSFGFIGNPKAYKLTFEQPSFGSGTYTPVTLSTSESNVKYINPGSFGENITEPVQMLTVSAPSSLSNAFTVGGVPSSSVTYDLIPLSFSSTASTSNALTVTGALSAATDFENQISSTHPLTIKFQGLTTSNTLVTATNTLTSYSEPFTPTFPQSITEITNITVSYVLPEMTVSGTFGTGGSAALSYSATPDEMYLRSGQSNYNLITISGNQVQFNQNNGQRPNFDMNAEANFNPVGHSYELFNYSMSEYPVPANQTSTDSFTVGLVNSSSANPTSPFILNYSAPISGSIAHDNVTYTTNTQGSTVSLNAAQGFYSEKGSEVASISPGSVTINFARGVDMLNFVVSPYNITAVSKNYKTVGPVGIGQPVPNVPNVTVESVTANISVSNASGATVTGISNLTAIPSVSSATTPVLLKNLTTSPLAVLNSTANPSSNLILIGSGFVNGLSAQLQASNNITFTPTSAPVLQAFGSNRILIAGYSANQTTAEANKFIQDLYASASTS